MRQSPSCNRSERTRAALVAAGACATLVAALATPVGDEPRARVDRSALFYTDHPDAARLRAEVKRVVAANPRAFWEFPSVRLTSP
ncbi:MAG: hypothetical protein ACRCT8_16225 [Lacipirellulaceae bacterium]